MSAVLYAFGGLPGVGKTSVSQLLAKQIGAVHLRIDTIEQAIRDQGLPVEAGEGYVVANRVAEDNLRLGLSVVADSVNPIAITRAWWRKVATSTGAELVEIEVVCSDPTEHRRRVESRVASVPGLVLPDWAAVLAREYEPWPDALAVDTAVRTVDQAVADILAFRVRGGSDRP